MDFNPDMLGRGWRLLHTSWPWSVGVKAGLGPRLSSWREIGAATGWFVAGSPHALAHGKHTVNHLTLHQSAGSLTTAPPCLAFTPNRLRHKARSVLVQTGNLLNTFKSKLPFSLSIRRVSRLSAIKVWQGPLFANESAPQIWNNSECIV